MPRKADQLDLFSGQIQEELAGHATPARPDGLALPPTSRASASKGLEPASRLISPPASLPPGARWQEIYLAGQHIGYVLQRSRRKSIGLAVNDDGLQVTAPVWVTMAQINDALHKKSNWILDKLQWQRERQEHLATADASWQDGGSVPYLGQPIVIRLNGGPLHQYEGDAYSPAPGDVLKLALPATAEHSRVRESVYVWMQSMAQTILGQRLQHYVELSGHTLKKWRLSSANTRWGSCSSEGHIMLNWRLIHFGLDIIDYVVAHEVAHLKHLNHSRDFWQEVERLLPDFQVARNALRRHVPGSLPLI